MIMKTITILLSVLLLPLAGHAQLQHASFEDWVNPVVENQGGQNRPVGWTISHGRGVPMDSNAYYPAVTDAQSGNYALMLGIWYTYTKDIASQTAFITYRPSALTGHYKYTNNRVMIENDEGNDQALAQVYLSKWNSTLGRRDTIGVGELILNAADDYTLFTCPITYTSGDVPDRVTVILDCSLMNRSGSFNVTAGMGGVASFFTVDSIAFVQESLTTSAVSKKELLIYPNPASDFLNITNFSGAVQLYDMTGKLLISQAEYKSPISVSNLSKGAYFLKLNSGQEMQYKRFIKE